MGFCIPIWTFHHTFISTRGLERQLNAADPSRCFAFTHLANPRHFALGLMHLSERKHDPGLHYCCDLLLQKSFCSSTPATCC